MAITIEITSPPDAFAVPSPAIWSPFIANPTTGPRKQKRQRKKVSFLPEPLIRNTLHRSDYTAKELRRTWLTTEDLYKSRQSCRRIANKFSKEEPRAQPPNPNHNNNFNNHHCFRGLEGRTKEGSARRKKIKWTASNAVLCEQRLQLLEETADGERLADVYYQQAEYARVEAHMVGLRDQAEAEYLHDCERQQLYHGNEAIEVIPTSLVLSSLLPSSKARCDPPGFRRSSFLLAHIPVRSESTRSFQNLAPSTRFITEAFFRV